MSDEYKHLNFFNCDNERIEPTFITDCQLYLANCQEEKRMRPAWMYADYPGQFHTTIEIGEEKGAVYHVMVDLRDNVGLADVIKHLRDADYELLAEGTGQASFRPIGETDQERIYAFRAFHRHCREAAAIHDFELRHIGYMVGTKSYLFNV